ncbi:hypothetical protein AKJ37_01045 [candidate division MSBL1 archaeon SCGC-AAA259I09]|uniref:DUF86 domain-containing protein n=2 Tax=candidate division MSBL1 TaxID=215777 RepID=A0A133UPX0_9EURY|nr:hypothetical protein AKJ38_03695 [candidate division MSBL1 archaeon SCGC-AAA259I14]KXA98205.1 hypothetical protein AKJ37_01045 [candidate division MSBL1 archaeon SCGC-AAA259I09]
MDGNRITRYRQKISVIEKRRENIKIWIDEEDEKSVLAVYKSYQELIESFTDIFAMIVKDMNELVEDDYTNIEKLRERGILSEEQEGLMKEANGLRNRLVHEYNGLERETAVNSIRRINSKLDKVLEKVKKWIKNRSKG